MEADDVFPAGNEVEGDEGAALPGGDEPVEG